MLQSMSSFIPSPLHPAIVHLPIALTLLVPMFAAGALIAIRRGARPLIAWSIPVALLALLLGSGWAAQETGEQDEEIAEQVVGDPVLNAHEEAAERFMFATGAVLLLAGVGLFRGRPGQIGRGVAAAGTIVLLGMGYQVGHSGGAIAYAEGGGVALNPGLRGLGGDRTGVQVSRAQRSVDGDERRDDR